MGRAIVSALQPGDGIDVIEVLGIRAHGHHGVLPEERLRGQPFIADVRLGVDTSAAAGDDDLGKTVNYADIAQMVHTQLSQDPVDLIETLAQRIADGCLAHPGVQVVEVVVHKPQAPVGVPASDVAIRILRRRMT